jgi:PEP-CTERM motif
MRKHAVALIVGAALSLWSSSAWALAYTISSSVAFNTGGVSGTINPVTNITGTTICLAGVCGSSVTHDWLLVTVTLNGGSDPVDRIDMSVAGVATGAVGAGHFTDPAETPTSGAVPSGSLLRFEYDNPNISALNLQAGETTDRLFGVWSPVGKLPGPGIPPPIPPGTANFSISEANSANDFSVQRSIVLVPEPGTWLMLGGGLIGLSWASRRSR